MTDSIHTASKSSVSSALFTWSNLVSCTRILVVFPIIILHYKNGMKPNGIIICLVAFGILTDYLDGFIARHTHSISEWGKILDPVADKTAAFFLFAYAVWAGLIPLWFFLVEVVRDLLILGGSLYIQRRHGKVAMAVTSGKWSVNVLSAYWICAFFLPDILPLKHFLLGCSLTLMILSFVDYIQQFNRIQKGAAFK
jgi:CDP-diacylglycerol--glycerol-3-phosphate 3-phosphatidyltransferase